MLTPETSSQNLPSPSRLTISVVVPVYNGGDHLFQCLHSLSRATPPLYEIIVVLDGCTDGSAQVAQQFGMKVLALSQRRGPAQARNFGAQAAQGDILFFLDADAVIHPDAIRQVQSAFSNDPQLTALFGSYDDEPGEKNFLSQYKNLFHHYVHQISREEASTFWSGCGAIRRKVFLKLGGFNEAYRKPCIEDIELGYRLKQAGYRIRLSKELQVKHLKRWNIRGLLKSDFFDRALPWTELILRDRGFINDLNLRISSRLSVVLTYGFLAALIGGYWWPGSFAVAGASALLLIIISLPVYGFFLRKRGFWFMIRTIPWHGLYYFYCGLAFAIGLGQFFFSRHKPSKVGLSGAPNRSSDTAQFSEGL
jgi:glycosyltransferase involved in cell wall biosynthesis